MLHRVKPAMAALAAGLVLLIAVGGAAADTIRVESRGFRATWTALSFANELVSVSCPVTLEGSFTSTSFSPVSGAQVGNMSRGSIAEARCTGGRARFPAESLPWRITYERAIGELPEVTGLKFNLIGMTVSAEASGLTCVYRSTTENPFRDILQIRAFGAEVTGLRADETARVPTTSGGFCALGGSGRASGTATVTEAASSAYELEAVVLQPPPRRYRPLGVNPEPAIVIPSTSATRDFILEMELVATLGTLVPSGTRRAAFSVSNGCNGRTIHQTSWCQATLTYREEMGFARRANAWLDVPFEGRNRLVEIVAERNP